MKTFTLNTKGTKPPIQTVEELIDRLRKHDFYHAMSDDHGVWQAGSADWKLILAAAKEFSMEDIVEWYVTHKHHRAVVADVEREAEMENEGRLGERAFGPDRDG